MPDSTDLRYVDWLSKRIGKWQIILLIISCITTAMLSANDMAMIFFVPEQEFHCDSSVHLCYRNVELSNSTYDHDDHANETKNHSLEEHIQYSMEMCSNWVYDKTFWQRTILEEWDLVCERDIILQFMSYIYMMSTIAGYIVCGSTGDSCGRKKTAVVCVVVLVVAGLILPFSINFVMFVIIRFIIGFCVSGSELNCFIWMMESLDKKGRVLFGMMVIICWSLGLLMLTGASYFIKDWTYIQVCITMPTLMVVFIVIYSIESPKWLMCKGKYDNALKTLNMVSNMNNANPPDEENLREEIESIMENRYETGCNFMNFFKKATLRQCTLVLLYIGFAANFLNFSGILLFEQVETDIFLHMVIISSLDIIGTIIAGFELIYFGRKCPIVCNILIGGVLCFALMVIPDYKHLHRLGVAILGKMFVATAGCQVTVYSIELFPTTKRALGFGLFALMCRLGSLAADLIVPIDYVIFPWSSMALKLFMCFLAGLLAFFLPETNVDEIPFNIAETCQIGSGSKSGCCPRKIKQEVNNDIDEEVDNPMVTTV